MNSLKLAERTLTLYSRRGCHLCEDMIETVTELVDEYDLQLEIIDVDLHPEFYDRYNTLVPVLCVNGQHVCHYFLDLASLKKTLGITT